MAFLSLLGSKFEHCDSSSRTTPTSGKSPAECSRHQKRFFLVNLMCEPRGQYSRREFPFFDIARHRTPEAKVWPGICTREMLERGRTLGLQQGLKEHAAESTASQALDEADLGVPQQTRKWIDFALHAVPTLSTCEPPPRSPLPGPGICARPRCSPRKEARRLRGEAGLLPSLPARCSEFGTAQSPRRNHRTADRESV
jgi:hypothetical protein